eukprot:m.490124 g.490124  ORF g.490124 m.490124 type:complete len:348 (+) comp27467_c0_seq1:85-1128(+)
MAERALLALQNLGCPVRCSRRDLLGPSQTRFAALAWLLAALTRLFGGEDAVTTAISSLNDTDLETSATSASIEQLTRAFAQLGACNSDDTATVQGTAPVEQQLEFWGVLTQLATVLGPDSNITSLNRQLRADIELLDAIANEPQGDLFKEDAVMFPPDVLRHCPPVDPDERAPDVLNERLATLDGQLRGLDSDLRHAASREAQYQTETSLQSGHHLDPRHGAKALEVSLTTLVQLVSDFSRTFDLELQAAVAAASESDDAPSTDELGSLVTTVLAGLENVQEAIAAAAGLRASFAGLTQRYTSVGHKGDQRSADPFDAAAVDQLDSFSRVVEQSTSRLQTLAAASTL